ncbi:MAG: hypothetical protein VB111_07900 [Clostridiaceae bacterium]|nr:hypothetical protein [Clostridiaceae bacterium]
MKNYVFDRFSDEAHRVINQTGVRQAAPQAEGNENFNACWDGALAPDGTFYYTLSSEAGKCDHAKLVRYDFDENRIIECFYAGSLVLPQDRQLPHSKLHTSINFMPRHAFYPEAPDDPKDYLVIATTHSTDRARQHVEWMPFGHHNHVWEGFPGSQILVYDPKTGHAQSLGTPVTHESIYGSKYDPVHNRLYMIGFMRGHVYCFDVASRRVTKDLGKVAELYCYRLKLGADGNIYGCTKAGQLFRIDTEKNELEHMNFRVPEYENNYVNNTWYRYMENARNHPSGKFMYMMFAVAPYMYKLDFATGEVYRAGKIMPGDGLYELPAADGSWNPHSFVLDKDGVIWFCVHHWSIHNDTEYTDPRPCYLLRWDVENGEEPYCCGIIGTEHRVENSVTEMEYDPERDILYCANVGRGFAADGPGVTAIDLSAFRPVYRERGPVSDDAVLIPRKLTPEELSERRAKAAKKIGEEVTEHNPYQAFPPAKVTPVRIWRSLPRLDVGESKVVGMAFEPDKTGEDTVLHVVCGKGDTFDNAKYVMRIVRGKVEGVREMAYIHDEYRAWLRANILPQPVMFDESIKLPEATGRRYRAKASAVADWNGGRKIVGTLDAMLAIVKPDGKVYSLGSAAAYGPIRCMVTDAAKTKLWGVAGDDEDMGYVFAYDDEEGLRQLGILNYNSHGYFDGPTASNVLSSIALSPDGKVLAIGGADRIGTVHIITL